MMITKKERQKDTFSFFVFLEDGSVEVHDAHEELGGDLHGLAVLAVPGPDHVGGDVGSVELEAIKRFVAVREGGLSLDVG